MNINDKAAYAFKINALGQLDLVNPDRKSTIAQQRISLMGRKSIKSLKNTDSRVVPEGDNSGSDSRLVRED